LPPHNFNFIMLKNQTTLSKETYKSPFCVGISLSAENAILSVSGTGNIDPGTPVELGFGDENIMNDFDLLPGGMGNLLF